MDLAHAFLDTKVNRDKPVEANFVAGRGAQQDIGYRILSRGDLGICTGFLLKGLPGLDAKSREGVGCKLKVQGIEIRESGAEQARG